MRALTLGFLLLIWPGFVHALYLEAGTGLGRLSSGDTFFGMPVANTSNFSASFSAYTPLTPPSPIGQIDLGLQTRATAGAAASGRSLAFGSANLGLRFEFWRFFGGVGFSPITYISKGGNGFLGLKGNRDACSYFLEAGAIWRVIPELQIIAGLSLETGLAGAAKSPLITEYGLRFRFPLDAKDRPAGGGRSFDGYRYPFGIMK